MYINDIIADFISFIICSLGVGNTVRRWTKFGRMCILTIVILPAIDSPRHWYNLMIFWMLIIFGLKFISSISFKLVLKWMPNSLNFVLYGIYGTGQYMSWSICPYFIACVLSILIFKPEIFPKSKKLFITAPIDASVCSKVRKVSSA